MRVTNIGCSVGTRSISRASSIATGDPCRDWSDHGLSAAPVAANRPSPVGSNMDAATD